MRAVNKQIDCHELFFMAVCLQSAIPIGAVLAFCNEQSFFNPQSLRHLRWGDEFSFWHNTGFGFFADNINQRKRMKVRISSLGLAVCLATAALVAGGCAGDRYKQSTGEYIDDAGITARVKKALANDGEYKFPDVNVTTFKGTVQLSGFVNSSDQKKRAAVLAKNVNGVK